MEEENKAAGQNWPKLSLGAGASGDTVIHVSEPNDSTEDNWDESDAEERTELLVRTLSIRGALTNQGKEAQDFLAKMDSDIKKIVSSTKTRKESLDDVASTLTRKSIQPLNKRRHLFSSVDCGFSWRGAVLAIFIVALLPLSLFFLGLIYPSADGTINNTTVSSVHNDTASGS